MLGQGRAKGLPHSNVVRGRRLGRVRVQMRQRDIVVMFGRGIRVGNDRDVRQEAMRPMTVMTTITMRRCGEGGGGSGGGDVSLATSRLVTVGFQWVD